MALQVSDPRFGQSFTSNRTWPGRIKISPMEDWDYSCGSGVFLRYLTYAYPQDETVRSAITDERKEIIANTAADPPFSGNNLIFKALDKLAAFNALLVISA